MSLKQFFTKANGAVSDMRECARVVFAGIDMPDDENLGDEAADATSLLRDEPMTLQKEAHR